MHLPIRDGQVRDENYGTVGETSPLLPSDKQDARGAMELSALPTKTAVSTSGGDSTPGVTPSEGSLNVVVDVPDTAGVNRSSGASMGSGGGGGGGGNTGGSNRNSLQQTIQDEMQNMMLTSSQEMEDGMDVLSQSKDRAQMTATSALSLSLIVLLKELLDRGPAANRYYYVSLSLVSSCIVLQIVIGALAIAMYQLRAGIKKSKSSKRSQYPSSATPDTVDGTQSAAPSPGATNAAYVVTETPATSATPASSVTGADVTPGIDVTDGALDRQRSSVAGVLRDMDAAEKQPSNQGCCPGVNTNGWTTSGSLVDDRMQEVYSQLADQYIRVLLELQEYYVTLGVSGQTADTADNEAQDLITAFKILGGQMRMLEYRNNMSRKRKIYSQMTAVQHAITYVLYAIFVIQAFITGFGVSG